jgi:hypothetical protein
MLLDTTFVVTKVARELFWQGHDTPDWMDEEYSWGSG